MDVIIHNKIDLLNFVDRYGNIVVKSMLKKNFIKFYIPNDEILLEYGIKQKALISCKKNLSLGRTLADINKNTGKLKSTASKYTPHIIIDRRYKEKKLLIDNNLDKIKKLIFIYRRNISEKRMKLHINYDKFKKLIDSTNFGCDPISCEVILFPCIIKQDWIAKSRIIYCLDTILKCQKYTSTPIYEMDNIIYSKVEYLNTFESPFTKREFNWNDIYMLPQNVLPDTYRSIDNYQQKYLDFRDKFLFHRKKYSLTPLC